MKTQIVLFSMALAAAGALADENEWFKPLGPPPVAAPRRISGGEAVPPLPLPATPLRRSERKREPKPPTLAGKVVWGQTASFTYDGGITTEIADWNLCPADLQQLLRKAQNWFGLPYGSETISLASFDGDPTRMPVLLFSGGRSLKLDKTQTELLRSFILNGGMAIFDSVAGSPYFFDSAKQVVREALPEFEARTIPTDHPLYHVFYDVQKVRYPKNLDSDAPALEGVYVGCRVGAVFSRYGLGCGWDDHEVPLIQKAVYYDVESANKIGLNLMAYAVGYANVGREEAKPELFGALEEKHPTDEFVFAQIRHSGAWNVHPGGAAALLRRLRQNTALRVSLKRTAVSPGRDDLSGFAFLYLTGLDDFQFDEKAVAALRHFLNSSGTLLISDGLGLRTFDQAARRELRKVLPDATLAPVPLTHPIYSTVFAINEARYTPAVTQAKPDLKTPYLEGITINGDLRVIYSPFDLECAWLGCEHPLAKAYEPQTGMQLGMNIVMYAMSH